MNTNDMNTNDSTTAAATYEFVACRTGRCVSCGMNGRQEDMLQRMDDGKRSSVKVCAPCLETLERTGDASLASLLLPIGAP